MEEFVLHRVEAGEQPHVFCDYSTLVKGEEEQRFLCKLLLRPFGNVVFTSAFKPADGGKGNRLEGLCSAIAQGESLVDHSRTIAQHLIDAMGEEPCAGELIVARFGEVSFGGSAYEAVSVHLFGQKEVFLQSRAEEQNMLLRMRRGLGTIKPTKACLVLFTPQEPTLLIVDRGLSTDAWQAAFIGTRPKKDHVNTTTEVLRATKNFITEQLPQDFVVDKADQIDLLNRSMEYFKSHDAFDREEFGQEVLQDEKAIDSFNRYTDRYQRENDVTLTDGFDIASQAVKRQARGFKSVLKLDKNFHIYIHGDRTKIEHGTDTDGRKFYKIYYEQEF